MSAQKIMVYTDGSSRGNPGPGGFGAILEFGSKRMELSQGFRHTTNNRMELMGVIQALMAVTKKNIPITIYTDSQYIVNSVEKKWLDNWIKTNFKGGKKNKDLWLTYSNLAKDFTIKFVWVKGHADNKYNNRCDELATMAADTGPWQIDEFYEAVDPKK